jgi:outer membrane protein
MWNKPAVIIFCIVTSLIALGLGISAQMSDTKLAYVRLTEVFDQFKMKQEMQGQLEREDLAARKILDSLAFTLTAEGNILDAQTNPDQNKVQDYLRRKDAYITQRQQFEDNKQAVTAKYDAQIIARMMQYIKDYGSQNGYRYIFGDDGNGNIMYAEPMDDLTTPVVAYLNERYSGQDK